MEFRCRLASASGEIVEGVYIADTEARLRHELEDKGLFVLSLQPKGTVAGLSVRPGYVLSDGFRVPGLAVPSLPVIGGDAAAACIAAASVLAKVSRDRLMVAMEADHPGYGFAEHKGYATPAHRLALRQLGPSPIHRMSWAPIRAVLAAVATT